nr:alpha-1,2-fucosyltransferase [uncultured Acetatifactor sp.]
MEKNKIYIPLQGRIGNQLFQYALARKIQLNKSDNAVIVMDDSDVLRCNWENSLIHYNLPNVEYRHDGIIENECKASKKYLLRKVYRLFTRNKDYISKYRNEQILNGLLNRNGMFLCENGYIEPKLNLEKAIYLEGYFQSHKYFNDIKYDLYKLFDGNQFKEFKDYPGLVKIRERNSVCISIKVEHNVGNSMYDVCSMDYWEKAIEYMIENVNNPLFFICSDNVEYVLEHLIDAAKYDYIIQDKKMPVHISLAVMAECKHFIIGNTTFGWWAQYLSVNQNKIVIAPSKWMAIDIPVDIYQKSWRLIEV